MKNILKSLLVSCLLLASNSFAQTQVMDGVDDGTVHIQLGHVFPYYGGVFTDAWMSSNGFILFYDPVNSFGNPYTYNNGCCNGFNPSGQGRFSYMLAPLWTDLRHDTGIPDSGYFYETGEGGTAFLWKNITEFGTNNLNTFGVQLWPDGSFDFHYADVNITNHTTWIGFTGDTTSVNGNVYDEVNELFYKTAQEGGMTTDHIANFASETFETDGNTYYAWYGQDGGYESSGPDCSNPLNDPSCEGYEEAYFEQQCQMNPLYDTQCSGYEQAYFDQQCQADALYDPACPGYAEAYYDQQCSIDPLYDSGCDGYAEAYYDQQCGLDPLYDSGCPGYEEAYFDQQCKLSGLYDPQCPNYATAYLESQCESNPLYSPVCSGYATAKAEEDAKLLFEKQQQEEMVTQTYSKEETFFVEQEEFFVKEEIVMETASTKPVESVLTEEEAFIENLVEESVVKEEIFEEKQEFKELFVEEEEILEPTPEIVEIIEEIDEEGVVSEEKLVDIETVLSIVSNEQEKSAKSAGESAEMSVSSQDDPTFATSSRSELHNAMSETLDSGENDDILRENDATSLLTTSIEQTESDSEDIMESQDSYSTIDAGFESQMTESFAAGGNIGTFLSGEAPNFSKFDIKPMSKQEQRQSKQVESLAEKMSNQAIEENIEKMKEDMQNSGGFDGNQAITVTLMGHVPNFNAYRNEKMPDQNEWYNSEGVYGNQKNVDNKLKLYKMMGDGDQLHKEMVLEQYGR